MKLTLIHGKYFNSWEALGLGYIGAYVKRHQPDITINFFQGCFDADAEIIEGAADADIVAFSCTTPTFAYVVNIARALKKINPSAWIVVGGYHPSAMPEQCLVDGIDQAVVGEGEAALLDIVRGNRARIIRADLMDFAQLPWPDRDLIKNERNIQVAYRDNQRRITSFQSHRGCPFACKYCADGQIKTLYPRQSRKDIVRHRAVSDLLDEIISVAEKYRLDLFKFSDPTWNISTKWVIEFCKEKIRRNLKIPFYPNIHAGVASEKMFALMAESGCHQVAIGVESGSQKILKQIGKGTTLATIRRSVKWARDSGIRVRGYFILGMPEESEEDVKMTEQFAEELNLDEYGFSILCPYPGSVMYDPEKFRRVDWEKADEYSNDFWRTRYLTNERLKEWQANLIKKFAERVTWHNKVLYEKTESESKS